MILALVLLVDKFVTKRTIIRILVLVVLVETFVMKHTIMKMASAQYVVDIKVKD